ncbi:DUF3465 domain-containing protein [Microbulbifer hainanensis]|uniref:DUF3465 domain-containing protein n=1 Tax=Microbulbifer hainanensis TaxID=2735675 RepID=UPI00186681F7|nr:DUF3465 domain-containing protein [Microbulbifer hainanensis]
MKKFLFLAIALLLAYSFLQLQDATPPAVDQTPSIYNSALQTAYRNRQSDIQVEGRGTVIKILSDDLKGSRHQRFILELPSGQTVLVAHNIDLAPKVSDLRKGDTVVFYGEYEWNAKGGVIHWTHRDPERRHVSGWLKHHGKIYQ